MLRFGKSTEYALLGLLHLTENPGRFVPAREVAEAYGLPQSLVGKILKCLHGGNVLESERGVRGGYRIAVDLSSVSLEHLMRIIRRAELGDRRLALNADGEVDRSSIRPTELALLALHQKLHGFLQSVSLSDLLEPGRRIDVPIELIGIRSGRRPAMTV